MDRLAKWVADLGWSLSSIVSVAIAAWPKYSVSVCGFRPAKGEPQRACRSGGERAENFGYSGRLSWLCIVLREARAVTFQNGYWRFDALPFFAAAPTRADDGHGDGIGFSDDRPWAAAEPARCILFIASPGIISQPLIDALSRELPFLVVDRVVDIDEPRPASTEPVHLVLAQWEILRKIDRGLVRLADAYPTAMIVLLETNEQLDRSAWADLPGGYLVRGVLPMNIKLDIWLSIIHLMVRGGEYFPPSVFEGSAVAGATLDHVPTPRRAVASLTPRERQVLDLVSRGYQNRGIASELNLSESTVKVHVHNVIAKLGSRNRTEAATIFRSHEDVFMETGGG